MLCADARRPARRDAQAALDALNDDPAAGGLSGLLAGLLARTGALAEADRAYELAIGLESDPAVRRFLQRQREQLEA